MRALQAVLAEENERKELGRRAVEFAIQGSWKEAAELNREIIEQYPDNVEAHNRLGKALMEMGSHDQAAEAFRAALSLSPYNGIARKNLDRLAAMGSSKSRGRLQAAAKSRAGSGVTRAGVTQEIGKSGVVQLVNLAGPESVSRLSPGDVVELAASKRVVKAMAEDGSPVGQVEPRLGARLARLIAGGNRYEASVKDLDGGGVALLIRETYQHPSQIGVVSFPNRVGGSSGYPGSVRYGAPAVDADDEDEAARLTTLKDWSDDDTEPGDDEAVTPAVHRIINSPGDRNGEF